MIILHIAAKVENGKQPCVRCGVALIDVVDSPFFWKEGSTVAQFSNGVPPKGTEFLETKDCQ